MAYTNYGNRGMGVNFEKQKQKQNKNFQNVICYFEL